MTDIGDTPSTGISTNAGWTELLDRVRRNTPTLLDEFLTELRDHDGYERKKIPTSDLEGTALQVFDLLLRRLEPSTAEADPEFTDTLGRRRARQGLRVDQFTEAVRINFRLLWRALHQAAQPDLVEVFMDNGERVLDVVERYATEVQRSFLDETVIMARSRRTARERALTKLFSGLCEADEFAEIAKTLGMHEDGVFEVIAMASNAVAEELRKELPAHGAYAYEDETMTYLFRHRQGLIDWIDSSSHLGGAYLRHVAGMAQIARAARLAKELHELHPGQESISLKSGFAALAASALSEKIAGFEHELMGGFADGDPAKQARLLDTIRTFLETGSVQATADTLFVHRNTVFKRLQTFQELSGLDVTAPRDATIALVLTCEHTPEHRVIA